MYKIVEVILLIEICPKEMIVKINCVNMLIQELFTMQILETSEMAQKSDWDKYTNIAWPKMELIWL